MLASRLPTEGASVRCWDPPAGEPWSSATRCASPEETMDGADAAVVVTQWSELKQADWARAVERMRQPVLFDGRNLLDPSRMSELGFTYMAVGRP